MYIFEIENYPKPLSIQKIVYFDIFQESKNSHQTVDCYNLKGLDTANIYNKISFDQSQTMHNVQTTFSNIWTLQTITSLLD